MAASFDGLDGSFAERLKALMAEAPGNVGLVSGFRSHDQQQQLWDKSDKTGKMVAKPGSSHHESGTAADLSFADDATLQWVHANAARFGLFFPMGWEPWHIEPMGGDKNPDAYTTPPDDQKPEDKVGGLFDIILGRRPPSSVGQMASAVVGQKTAVSQSIPGGEGGGGGVDYQKAYDLVIAAGGTPEEAAFLAKIAKPESGYNPQAHNTNAATGDNSYGLWQINMLGGMGTARAKNWGLSSYDDLFDPETNAKAALSIYRSQGPKAWQNSLSKVS